MRISDWSSYVCFSDLQRIASKPVLTLRLLLNRQVGSVAVMALALGMVMYGSTCVIPQFLAIISDYNAFQTGLVIFWMGIPAFVLMPILPFMIRRLNIRIAVGVGMLLMARSEERRVWNECFSTCQFRWSAYPLKK